MHSPTQLTNYLSCNHLAALELANKQEILKRPFFNDPVAELLKKHGQLHEQRYLEILKSQYTNIVEITHGNFEEKVKNTINAMKNGAEVIFQGALSDGIWKGYSDFLIKVNTPSGLGDYLYIIEDTKLSEEAKGTSIMQLCIYADLVKNIQGKLPDEIAIIGGIIENRLSYNPADFMSYLAYAKRKYLDSLPEDLSGIEEFAPEPVERCHTCNWRGHCEEVWHKKDHLKLVAGSGRLQRKELKDQNINTLTELAELPKPPALKRGSKESAEKIYKQAQIQLKGRKTNQPEYEFIVPVVPQQGFCGLPVPSKGDIWFDIEGDAFIGGQGLEYLFGWVTDESGTPEFHFKWSMNTEQEKNMLREFVQFVLDQYHKYPDMHVYHFGHYETSVIKRLTTRYNIFVDEVDDLLRHEVFIDLHRVVKNGLRLSVEGYGLKNIEGHYDLERKTDLFEASRARKNIALLLDSEFPLENELIKIVQDYNEEDCISTFHLHRWLEKKRDELIEKGEEAPRFVNVFKEPEENKKLEDLSILCEQLYQLLPEDLEQLTDEQSAIKSLADMLLWYRREDKSHWWEFFNLRDLSRDELKEQRKGLAGPFKFLEQIGEVDRSVILRWKFTDQIFEGKKETLHFCHEKASFKDYKIDLKSEFLDIKVGKQNTENLKRRMFETGGLVASTYIASTNQVQRLKSIGEFLQNNSIATEGDFQVGRNLLLKNQVLGQKLKKQKDELILDTAIRLCKDLKEGTILPIQGPPGTGKTYTAAHMICELIKAGKKVGVTAQGHSVIRNLLDKIHKINEEKYKLDLKTIKQAKSNVKENFPDWITGLKNEKIDQLETFDLIGGTSWLWSREGMANKVDVLFIDEAGQFSLADAVASSHTAKSMVLLGDPQQLENVTQGVHPPEIEVSVLGYWLGDHKVMEENRGLFLDKTYRMAPGINNFISETFYEGKVDISPGLDKQQIISKSILNGSGIKYLECKHEGNQSNSEEEVNLIVELVEKVMNDGKWIDKNGTELKLNHDDIMIVAPYNAQVNALKEVLPEIEIGTVDKFQGREAPIVIYSMATSSPEEAPRGMEFLYSLNRLNVAISRAQCLAVIVASPTLFDVSCKTPHQMRLANAFCKFLEMAT